MQPGPLNPANLPPGALVGPWRIVDRRGSGTYGSVYLAEGTAPEGSGIVALKLAHHPWNARFGREAELLSRLRHPCVPRLFGQGHWLAPSGLPHFWLAMELVEGIPLYEWARAIRPSSRQVLQVLAGVARALEATHAAGGVHRDVKGDNVLVRLSDGQPFLIDFGSGSYQGAPSMTWQVFPPGTPPYRSPEAWRFAVHIGQQPVKIFSPTPADDVFALGVTAYKLVTGEYPPSPEPLDPRSHVWRTDGPGPQPARELNSRCAPELSALSSRMLSRQPEARGSARELAEALEHAAREAGPEADAPLFVGGEPQPISSRAAGASQSSDAEATLQPIPPRARRRSSERDATPHPIAPRTSGTSQPSETDAAPQLITPRASGTSRPSEMDASPQLREHDPSWRPRLALASAAGFLALGAIWVLNHWSREHAEWVRLTQPEDARDAGTAAVGESVLTAPVASAHAPSAGTPIAQEIPSEPLPGQIRTDARGRCPMPDLIPLKGGCWMKLNNGPKECAESEFSYTYKGACYVPVFRIRGRPATSSPPETRDGG
jgi:serine/threonine protein kinase